MTRARGRLAAGLAMAALSAAGCATVGAAPTPLITQGVAAVEPAANPGPFAAADTAFGLDVLGAWCRTAPGANLVLSPSSLASGLGMAYLGARGATARAMARVLRLPVAGGPALAAGLHARSAALRDLGGPGATVSASDQIWADPTLGARQGYLNAIATAYGAGLAQAPLLSSPDRAVAEIDRAVAAATHGQIPQLLAPGSLQGIGWVLTDALYLHAAWASPFQADLTTTGRFTTAAGGRVRADYLRGGGFLTAGDVGWTAVRLPYRDGALAMVALLPPAGSGGCALPSAATAGALTARLSGPAAGLRRSAIALPTVHLRTQKNLTGLLTQLGMGLAFSPTQADFSGLSKQACCITSVEHAATLRVTAAGTVAAAATGVGVSASAALNIRVSVAFNRPYLLLVTGGRDGEPLFLARVADPAAG